MTSNPLITLLKKAHAEAPCSMKFIQAVRDRCNVSQSTVYRWLEGETFPKGETTLNLVEYLKSKEP